MIHVPKQSLFAVTKKKKFGNLTRRSEVSVGLLENENVFFVDRSASLVSSKIL